MMLGALVAGALACAGQADEEPPPPVVAMMPETAIPMSLASNYAFMSLQFALGDVASFGSNYDREARLFAPGYVPLVSRFEIQSTFAPEGRRLGVREFNRHSQGIRVDGRDVLDSGTYELVGERAVPDTVLDATGRYWTRWRFQDNGEWIIVTDSLVGAGRLSR